MSAPPATASPREALALDRRVCALRNLVQDRMALHILAPARAEG